MKRITKILVFAFAPVVLAVNRVFALTAEGVMVKYGPAPIQPVPLYGVVAPPPTEIAINVLEILIIPVAIIIFLIFGIRKLRKNKKKIKK